MDEEDFKYKPTTALWKIKKLIADGLPQFKEDQQKVFIIEGGQGAGKTIAIMMLIHDYFNRIRSEITICSAQLSKLKATALNDFKKIMQDYNLYEDRKFNIAESIYKKADDWFVEFLGLDKADVGKGRRRRLVYINEANKITLEQYTDITARADMVIMDFNPDASFYAHDLITDFNYLNLTFLDNEYLSKNEIRNILSYKQRGYSVDQYGEEIIISEYWANKWRVYGLGEIGMLEGVIFQNWKKVPWPKEARLLYYGGDFGYSISKLAFIGIFNFNGAKYLKSFVYANNLTNQQGAAEFKKAGYTTGLVYCDSAEPKSIAELRKEGINAVACDSKIDIKDFAIQELNGETFYVDENDKDLINELEHLRYNEKTQKPQKSKIDHLTDALFYGVGSAGKYSGKYL